MNSGKYIAHPVFTFHQWKGKKYAAFASLGRLVRIGRLSTALSQNFYAKNISQPASFLNWTEGAFYEEESAGLQGAGSGERLLQLAGVLPVTILILNKINEKQPSSAGFRIFDIFNQSPFSVRYRKRTF